MSRLVAGRDESAARRSGWGQPIHDLLVKHRVTAVFNGHLYVRQELDGIVYLEVPQPSHPENNTARSAAEYGYAQGTILGSPGRMRVRIAPDQATLEYVRSRQLSEESPGHHNGEVAETVGRPGRAGGKHLPSGQSRQRHSV